MVMTRMPQQEEQDEASSDAVVGVRAAWARLEYMAERRAGSADPHNQATSSSQAAPRLPPLKLRGLHLDQASIAVLTEKASRSSSSHLVKMESVTLQECTFVNLSVVQDFCVFLRKVKIQELCVFDTLPDHVFLMEEPVLACLLTGLKKNIHLKRLVLCCASLSGTGTATSLQELLQGSSSLEQLSLPNCSLDETVFHALLLGGLRQLQSLDMSRCKLDERRSQMLAYALDDSSTRLHSLNLSRNDLSAETFTSLARLLNQNNGLRELILDKCNLLFLDDDDKQQNQQLGDFTAALGSNTSLQTLSMSACLLTPRVETDFLTAISENTSLTKIIGFSGTNQIVHRNKLLQRVQHKVQILSRARYNETNNNSKLPVQQIWLWCAKPFLLDNNNNNDSQQKQLQDASAAYAFVRSTAAEVVVTAMNRTNS